MKVNKSPTKRKPTKRVVKGWIYEKDDAFSGVDRQVLLKRLKPDTVELLKYKEIPVLITYLPKQHGLHHLL